MMSWQFSKKNMLRYMVETESHKITNISYL